MQMRCVPGDPAGDRRLLAFRQNRAKRLGRVLWGQGPALMGPNMNINLQLLPLDTPDSSEDTQLCCIAFHCIELNFNVLHIIA